MADPYVVAIGGSNMDLHGQATADLIPGSSNPGSSQLSPGGVARNVAEVIARLGTRSYLVSTVGEDPLGTELVAHTAEAGVDVTHVRRRPLPTGTYAAVITPQGELFVAVADMAVTDEISPLAVGAAATLIHGARLLVLDGNLLPATVEHALDVAEEAEVPVVIDPASVPKAERLRPLLGRGVGLITPNRPELAALSGMPTRTEEQVEEAVEQLHAVGVRGVWVGLGADGTLLSVPEGRWRLPAPQVETVDVTGGGDTRLGAFCHALLRGDSHDAAARYGQAAGALTVMSRSTVRSDLSEALIRTLL